MVINAGLSNLTVYPKKKYMAEITSIHSKVNIRYKVNLEKIS